MTVANDACLGEEEVAQLFTGRLSPEEQARVEARMDAHVDSCPRCLDLVAGVARGLDAATGASDEAASDEETDVRSSSLSAGQVVQERYEVLERVGIGAMGVVYAAFDRVLDRKVALKVLRPDTVADERAQVRLIREARLLARLSHPNVIVVYDVGATAGGGVVMAMELVAGRTLRAWGEGPSRPSRDAILTTFVSAGRGLAAAHAAGVIHRDFKPDNVLVGDDGRVRVTDFGLAHGPPQAPSAEAASLAWLGADERRSHVVGTPRYMAPELFAGSVADERSDQFAFAVALYEALYRESPFPVASLATRLAAIRAGEFVSPARPGVPRWLRSALLRGLAADPARRFPSMEAMCDAIDPARRRRLHVIAGSVVSTIGAALLGAVVLAPVVDPSQVVCEGAAQRLAGVWDDEVRGELRAVLATDDPRIVAGWSALERDLDAIAAVWSQRYDGVCADVQASVGEERERSRVLLSCLEHSVEWIRTATAMARRGDGDTLSFLVRRELPKRLNGACASPEAAREFDPLPEAAAQRQRVIELRMQLDEVQAIEGDNRLDEARVLASQVAEEAVRTGFGPLIAEALYRRGVVEHRAGALAEAQATLEWALATAETARHEGQIPQIWLGLALVDVSRGRFAEASRGLDRATAFLARHPLSAHTMAGLGSVRASILRSLARHREAIKAEEQSRAYREAEGGDELLIASSLVAQASSHAELGERKQALELNQRALEIRERVLGPAHTRVAGILNNIGAMLMEMGAYGEAKGYFERALTIRESPGASSEVERSHVLLNLGILEREQGRAEKARGYIERALSLRARVLGMEHPRVAEALEHLGKLLVEQGDVDVGRQHLERALSIRDRSLGPSHPITALSRVELARAELARGQLPSARALVEKARELLAAAEVNPVERAVASFVLAQVLHAGGGDASQIRRLAEEARDELRRSGREYTRDLAEVEAFLAARATL